MDKQEEWEEQLRAEFKREWEQDWEPQKQIFYAPNNKSGYMKDGNLVADWWINKIQSLRSKDRDTLIEKFKIKFNGYGGNLGFTLSDVKQIILETLK